MIYFVVHGCGGVVATCKWPLIISIGFSIRAQSFYSSLICGINYLMFMDYMVVPVIILLMVLVICWTNWWGSILMVGSWIRICSRWEIECWANLVFFFFGLPTNQMDDVRNCGVRFFCLLEKQRKSEFHFTLFILQFVFSFSFSLLLYFYFFCWILLLYLNLIQLFENNINLAQLLSSIIQWNFILVLFSDIINFY